MLCESRYFYSISATTSAMRKWHMWKTPKFRILPTVQSWRLLEWWWPVLLVTSLGTFCAGGATCNRLQGTDCIMNVPETHSNPSNTHQMGSSAQWHSSERHTKPQPTASCQCRHCLFTPLPPHRVPGDEAERPSNSSEAHGCPPIIQRPRVPTCLPGKSLTGSKSAAHIQPPVPQETYTLPWKWKKGGAPRPTVPTSKTSNLTTGP